MKVNPWLILGDEGRKLTHRFEPQPRQKFGVTGKQKAGK